RLADPVSVLGRNSLAPRREVAGGKQALEFFVGLHPVVVDSFSKLDARAFRREAPAFRVSFGAAADVDVSRQTRRHCTVVGDELAVLILQGEVAEAEAVDAALGLAQPGLARLAQDLEGVRRPGMREVHERIVLPCRAQQKPAPGLPAVAG